MTLTAAQQAQLEAPFALNEHRYDASGNIYIDKEAIRRRLFQVDPNWSQSLVVESARTANTVSLTSTITICGTSRSALGVAIINRWKKISVTKKDPETGAETKVETKAELEGYDLARAEKLAYKSADADLLPRIGYQFNVGTYLKSNGIKNETQLKAYLAKLTPATVATHWADNGGRERVANLLAKLGLEWAAIKDRVEPGKILALLKDTTLDEAGFTARLAEIAFKPAAPQVPPPAPPPPAPATAPKSDPQRYGVPPAPSTTPPPDEPIDLNQYFAPTPTAAPASPDPLNKVYATPYERRNSTVRNVHNPSGRKEHIGYIKCLPVDLDTHDIILVEGEPRTIIAAYPPEHGDRRFLLKDAAGNEHDYKLTLSLSNAEIVGGPKLAAAQDNPALAPMSGPHRLWVGEKEAQVAS